MSSLCCLTLHIFWRLDSYLVQVLRLLFLLLLFLRLRLRRIVDLSHLYFIVLRRFYAYLTLVHVDGILLLRLDIVDHFDLLEIIEFILYLSLLQFF